MVRSRRLLCKSVVQFADPPLKEQSETWQELERLAEFQEVNQRQDPKRRRNPEKIVVSVSDPASALGRDKFNVFRPLYNVQLVCDLDSPLYLGYQVFAQPTDAGTFRPMLQRVVEFNGEQLQVVLVDAGYVTACHLAFCAQDGITLYGPWQENDLSQKEKKAKKGAKPKPLGKEHFTWSLQSWLPGPPGPSASRSGSRAMSLLAKWRRRGWIRVRGRTRRGSGNRLDNRFSRCRFGQVSGEAGLVTALDIFLLSVAAQRDRRELMPTLAQLADQIVPAAVRKSQVAHQQVEAVVACPFQSRRDVAGRFHRVPLRRQHDLHHLGR